MLLNCSYYINESLLWILKSQIYCDLPFLCIKQEITPKRNQTNKNFSYYETSWLGMVCKTVPDKDFNNRDTVPIRVKPQTRAII